jgi:hypothetical protein
VRCSLLGRLHSILLSVVGLFCYWEAIMGGVGHVVPMTSLVKISVQQ